jgi:DNA-binding NarL/FixJ family response regulator
VRLGVRGVVSKKACRNELLKAVRLVSTGQFWLGRDDLSEVLESLLGDGTAMQERNGRPEALPLTARERRVVTEVVRGLCNREIASRLAVSEDTVKHHLTNIYDKLGVSSRVELVVHAMGHGLDPDA